MEVAGTLQSQTALGEETQNGIPQFWELSREKWRTTGGLSRNHGYGFLTPHLQPTGKAKGSESGQGLGFIHRTIGAAEPNLTVHGFPELRSVPFMSVNLSASLRSLPASSPVRLKGGAKQLPTARGKYSGSYRLLAA